MMKKLTGTALAVLLIFTNTGIAFCAENAPNAPNAPNSPGISLDTLPVKSILLMDGESGRVLFEKNADEKTAPASITKIMTMLLLMEEMEDGKIAMTDMVTCSRYAAGLDGATIWLEEGEKMSVKDLLKAVAVSSANDASAALGAHIAGSEEAFVAMMNKKAKALGMMDTNFVNSSGLDAKDHYSTARDMAVMAHELMRYEEITDYTTIWMDELRGGKTELVNTNRLIRFYSGATGIKTGATSAAGNSLAASATRNNLSLIAVVLGAKTSEERFDAAKAVLDYGFANYEAANAPAVEGDIKPVKVLGGMEKTVEVTYQAPEHITLAKDEKSKLTWEISMAENVKAPVEQGQVLGKVLVSLGEEPLCEYPLLASKDIEAMTFLRGLEIWVKALGRMKS